MDLLNVFFFSMHDSVLNYHIASNELSIPLKIITTQSTSTQFSNLTFHEDDL